MAEIRDDLNDSITEAEAIEMLAQHLITRPVFDALFEGYSFARNNPVSKAMEAVLEALDEHRLEKEAETLEGFYASVERRAAGIQTAEAKQRIVVELYDKFFRNAFPKMTERLGIVYTPVEVVDFIIHSVNEVLQSEFGQTLGSKGVHILDPFTGTGTFITRLLQSGLIAPDQLEHKYKNEIHANEIVLLAYYIAAINIEAVYHGLSGGDYAPFEGICLTDTFQLYEQDKDLLAELMPDNSNRRTRQKELDIRVILGNPPYSVGQASANDNAANVVYTRLDTRIRETYAARSDATLKNALYDSYIRAIRWATDRIGDAGIIGFVSNAGWIDGQSFDGLRKCLADELASIHVFHLRGNQRTSGERSKREGGKIFGSGSRTPVAISLLVKNPDRRTSGQIRFYDIGDYLTREEKLERVASYGSLAGIDSVSGWQTIEPDGHGDWLGQRDKAFDAFLPAVCDGDQPGIFLLRSRGLMTCRDVWNFNFSREKVKANVSASIAFFNSEVVRIAESGIRITDPDARNFVEMDPAKISWDRPELQKAKRGVQTDFVEESIVLGLYRPFQKCWTYTDRKFNNCVYQLPRIFPDARSANRVIGVSGVGHRGRFSTLMSSHFPSLNYADMDSTQCFPRYLYEDATQPRDGELALEEAAEGGLVKRDAITNAGLAHFQAAYPGEAITKDDLFYYVYGLLHSPEYRERFADNLSKQLPRIAAVKKAANFWAFVEAGRKLGDLHCDFDNAEPYPVTIGQGDLRLATIADPEKYYRVEKMKFAGKRPNLDKTTVIYNSNITITGIPLEAYDYVVNGKAALDWVMERQCVKVDKKSGIVNDANRYAIETMGDPAYPLKLFQRVITISLETMKIVNGLPKLEID